jgi:hypothetical protein
MKGLRIQSLLSISLAVLALMFIAPVQAADDVSNKGWFFELGIGSARDRNDVNNGIEVSNTNYVKRGYLGYRLSDYMGVQGGFLNVSPIKYKVSATNSTDEYSYEGLHGKFFFNVPFHRDADGFYAFSLTAGGWRWDSEVKSPSGNSHTTGISPTGSVGLLFSGRTSAIKIEYERLFLKPEVAPGDFADPNQKVKLKYDAIMFNFLFFI